MLTVRAGRAVGERAPIATVMASSVERGGMTVTFDQPYPVGQYVTGDWFVVGSPTVTSVSPAWNGEMNGSMVDPVAGTSQGYRGGTAPRYSEPLRATFPRVLTAGSSLVHTRGWATGDPGAPDVNATYNVPRPAVRSAMALTAVTTAPTVGSFRPPYTAGPKDTYRESDLRWDRLLSLTPPASTPAWDTRTGPWLDHVSDDLARYVMPSDTMESYGRDIGSDANSQILKLHLNYTQEQKRPALLRMVQAGIDLYGCVRSAHDASSFTYWWGGFGGAIGTGRKWPILFAGLMLDDNRPGGMVDVCSSYGPGWWGEDGQTYISQGGAHELRAAGLASWGERATTRPNDQQTGIPGNTSYRTCCTGTVWGGAMLAALMMDARPSWGWEPFFDYTDWYVGVDQATHGSAWPRFWTTFLADMWLTHRANY